jgi:hypothetical protein
MSNIPPPIIPTTPVIPVITTIDDLTVDNFNALFTVNIVRYEQYPADEPNCYVVGYTIKHNNNGKNMYVDTQVSFTDASGLSDDLILNLAWDKVLPCIKTWAFSVVNKNPIINSNYVPTNLNRNTSNV